MGYILSQRGGANSNINTTGDGMRETSDIWYNHKMYSRFWKHYQLAMGWLQKHRRAYRKAVESLEYSPWYNAEPAATRFADWHNGLPCYSSGHTWQNEYSQSRQGQCPHSSEIEVEDLNTEADMNADQEGETDSDSEIECDISNVEITEELRQYFKQTENHKEELKRQQQYDDEQQAKYVLADRDFHSTMGRTIQPPAERPGERRLVEMKKLYGDDATKIQGMETAMQLLFDRKCDEKQPKYWPVIPLKL
ncbi:gem-associated protein 8 isoform X3 [Scyliorhinus canicula]|uniref:gem-associated protein 8 isoform X3 n=1 Tax=Scyliorhinus canicula TaxID=7830 RepID=UPI0018F6A0D3|nr:gem-associated protein 8 isoform X3 [Scyliorhinus canicula]